MCATSKPQSRHYTKKSYHSQNSEFTIKMGFPSRYIFFNLYTTHWSLVEISCHAILSFMHSTVLHTWFHKNSRQCALSLFCCSKSYQQSAPQDTIIHWSNDKRVNVISTLHNYILYTLFFYQCLSDQFSKHMTMKIFNQFPFFTYYWYA